MVLIVLVVLSLHSNKLRFTLRHLLFDREVNIISSDGQCKNRFYILRYSRYFRTECVEKPIHFTNTTPYNSYFFIV